MIATGDPGNIATSPETENHAAIELMNKAERNKMYMNIRVLNVYDVCDT
jgi:hypothetical protein